MTSKFWIFAMVMAGCLLLAACNSSLLQRVAPDNLGDESVLVEETTPTGALSETPAAPTRVAPVLASPTPASQEVLAPTIVLDELPTSQEIQPAPAGELPGGQALRQGVAFLLNAPPEELHFSAILQTDLTNPCLGVSRPVGTCCCANTSGYQGLVEWQGQIFTFQSDLSGKQVRLKPLAAEAAGNEPTTSPTGTSPAEGTPGIQATPSATLETKASPTPAVPASVASPIPTSSPLVPPSASVLTGLARSLRVSPEQVKFLQLTQAVWPDLCFDFLHSTHAACPAILTPGYQGVLEIIDWDFGGDPIYWFRSDSQGKVTYLLPSAALAAALWHSEQSGSPLEEIEFAHVAPLAWPDTCAMTPSPLPANSLCIQVPLPGWRVALKVGEARFEYLTDLNGLVIQAAP